MTRRVKPLSVQRYANERRDRAKVHNRSGEGGVTISTHCRPAIYDHRREARVQGKNDQEFRRRRGTGECVERGSGDRAVSDSVTVNGDEAPLLTRKPLTFKAQ